MKNFFTLALFAICCLLLSISSYAQQNIGIGTTTPNTSAILDITSTNKGLLLPRLTTTQRDAITAPIPESLIIYNTTTQCYEGYNTATSKWVIVGSCITFVCGNTLTVTHTAGTVAPVTKTVNYGTVQTSLSGASKCWITQNLGADHSATSVTDATEPSGGWYWQFNRIQGYKTNASAPLTTPAWTITSISESSNWLSANDPCTQLLGVGWRIPLQTEWASVVTNSGWTTYTPAYASVLKLHTGGQLPANGTARTLTGQGFFYSSTQVGAAQSYDLNITSTTVSATASVVKATALTLRCLKD